MIANEEPRIASAERGVAADAATIFELIADPVRQLEWDGNNNLREAVPGQRIRGVGDVFTMVVHDGSGRENYVIEFDEGRLVAWQPAPTGEQPRGHIWRWELEPLENGGTLVRHTYDWTQLTDETRFARARATTPEALQRSVDRLAALAEAGERPGRDL